MEKYKELTYLLGCYIAVADKEINAHEVDVLDSFLSKEEMEELSIQRQKIFSDDEEKQDLHSLITELKLMNITKLQKQEMIRFLADVAYGDDYMPEKERQLLDEVVEALNIKASDIISDSENRSKERIKSSQLGPIGRFMGKAANVIYNSVEDNGKRKTVDLLLGKLGYSESIAEITDIALIDLERVSKIVDGINNSLKETNDSLKQLENQKIAEEKTTQEVNEVANTIREVKKQFDNLIDVSLKENLEMLDKKRRNIRYFTIAFMGRTKAGKSTLHKVITQQEKDDIGVGKLRTTRYNRSWYWNKLRIVDTPGIGAPGGATDTEIAKSIIDEADIICYVVTSDSIQETEFDFFETIKERNKPLYIILNVKSNLTQPIRLKRFLENPKSWMECTGPQSIKGHLDRIHERLDGKYNMDAVEIIPIHLLAAQLGFSGELSKKNSKKLQRGSNIFAFTKSVYKTVRRTGGLKKSLSVVDGTSYQIHQIGVSLTKDLNRLKKDHDLIKKKYEKVLSFLDSENKKLVGDIKSSFSGVKSELHNHAAAFSNENYDKCDAGKRWEEDSVVKQIYSKLETLLNQRMDDYNNKLQDQINEIANDIQILGSYNAEASVSGEKIRNTKLGVGIVGSLISLAAPFIISNLWHPGGWILAGLMIGVMGFVSIVSSLFTSKEDKIKKAIDEMRKQLYTSIDENIDKCQQDFLTKFQISAEDITRFISKFFLIYINGTEQIINKIDLLCKQSRKGENALNSLVSLRMLKYVGLCIEENEAITSLNNTQIASMYPVERNWSNQTMTYHYEVHLSNMDIQKISRATQMNITIN